MKISAAFGAMFYSTVSWNSCGQLQV